MGQPRKRATAQKATKPAVQPVETVRVPPVVMATALELAGGNKDRLRVIDGGRAVLVTNHGRLPA